VKIPRLVYLLSASMMVLVGLLSFSDKLVERAGNEGSIRYKNLKALTIFLVGCVYILIYPLGRRLRGYLGSFSDDLFVQHGTNCLSLFCASCPSMAYLFAEAAYCSTQRDHNECDGLIFGNMTIVAQLGCSFVVTIGFAFTFDRFDIDSFVFLKTGLFLKHFAYIIYIGMTTAIAFVMFGFRSDSIAEGTFEDLVQDDVIQHPINWYLIIIVSLLIVMFLTVFITLAMGVKTYEEYIRADPNGGDDGVDSYKFVRFVDLCEKKGSHIVEFMRVKTDQEINISPLYRRIMLVFIVTFCVMHILVVFCTAFAIRKSESAKVLTR